MPTEPNDLATQTVTVSPSPTKTKKYMPLSILPTGSGPSQIKIGTCSAVLDNHLQCWRAGDIYVEETTVIPADGASLEKTKVTSYQYCRRHAVAALAADAKTQNDYAALTASQAAVVADTAQIGADTTPATEK
jgi:hypothetical protein